MVDFGFDTGDLEVSNSFADLPDNKWLSCRVDKCEVKKWENGNTDVSFHLKLVGGEFDGRIFFHNCTVKSTHDIPSTKEIIEKIARENITKLAMACGVKSAKNSDDMIGKMVEFKLKRSKDGNYQNVSAVRPLKDQSVQKAEKGSIDW